MDIGTRDHYVSRTYLKRFSNESDKIWVYNKKYLNIKEKFRKSICHKRGWSDNHFLEQPRMIENYLKQIENHWAGAVDIFTSAELQHFEDYKEAKAIIAGYVAYLKLFPPSVSRVGQSALENMIYTTMEILEKSGDMPRPPKGFEYIAEDFRKHIKITVDEKYPLALGMNALGATLETFYSSPWMRLINKSEIPFITSDNPACGWFVGNSHFPFIYVPLSPRIAILIKPVQIKKDFEEEHSEDAFGEADDRMVLELNQLICQCAEETVLSNINSNDLRDMVKKNKDWEYGNVSTNITLETGHLIINQWKAQRRM